MQQRTALVLALVCGGLAVLVVATDMAWSLDVSLETLQDGEWVVVASGLEPWARPLPVGCAGPEMRLVVDNGGPLGRTLEYSVTWWDVGRQRTIVTGELEVSAFSRAEVPFTVPEDAFTPRQPNDPRPSTHVEAVVGGQSLGVCVQADDVEAWHEGDVQGVLA